MVGPLLQCKRQEGNQPHANPLHNDIKICLYLSRRIGPMDRLVNMLKAAGDNTRLRLLLLLLRAELTVSELTQIIGQSQPRVSRHLKLLCEAGLLARFKEGAWVFYRAADRGDAAKLAQVLSSIAEGVHASLLA